MKTFRKPPRTGKVERLYARQLKRIARHVGDIINAFEPGNPEADPAITRILNEYSDAVTGWATLVGSQMLAGVKAQDDKAWRDRSNEMRTWLRDEILNAPTGTLMRGMLDEQIALIKSLPTEAATRVHEWTQVGIQDATRAKEVAAAIRDSSDVTANRAILIARTEVARTASKLTESRARYVGSDGYIWRTSGDSDVRHSHREMDGKFVRWDVVPTLSDGTTTHAGQIYNCRCYPEPVIPE